MGGSDFYKIGSFKLVDKVQPKLMDNIWYDISATVYIYADSPYRSQLEWIMRSVGTDRILFGSDDPAVSLSETLKAFKKLKLTKSERERILYKNAKDLLVLE